MLSSRLMVHARLVHAHIAKQGGTDRGTVDIIVSAAIQDIVRQVPLAAPVIGFLPQCRGPESQKTSALRASLVSVLVHEAETAGGKPGTLAFIYS